MKEKNGMWLSAVCLTQSQKKKGAVSYPGQIVHFVQTCDQLWDGLM